jgi:hypothetical protein
MTNFANAAALHDQAQISWECKYQQLLIDFLRTHDEFDGSAVAAWMRKRGLGDPIHHNMWGAQITYYAHAGWMKAVGRTIPTGASHVAQVRLWKSQLYKKAGA